jgi:hypothetical protein
LPATLTVKSEGLLVPPLIFVVTVKNVFEPIGAVELFDAAEPFLPFEEDDVDVDVDVDEVLLVEFFGAA